MGQNFSIIMYSALRIYWSRTLLAVVVLYDTLRRTTVSELISPLVDRPPH